MPLSDEKTGEKTRVRTDVVELKIFRRRGDAVVKHVFQTGPTHIWKEGRVGVTTTDLRVRTRYRVVTGGRDKDLVFFGRRACGRDGERKKPPPSESRRGYRSISVPESVRGCACACVFFSTVSCFTPRVFLLADPSPQRRLAPRGRFYSFIYYYPRFFVFFSSTSQTGHATWTFARRIGVGENLSRLIFFHNDDF